MKFYLENIKDVFAALKTSEKGLGSAEAAERLAENGLNKLAEGKKTPLWKRFFAQMTDPMIIILLIAAAVSAVTEYYEASHAGAAFFPTDTVIILLVVVINSILGVVQESKAEAAIEALQKMSAATTKVLRDGKSAVVKSEELTVGDVVLLEAGDAVPADCRIFESASLKIEEAALTGESVPVNKLIEVLTGDKNNEVPLGDRKNMAYMGSTVVYGRGRAVVVATGMDTEMGKIAHAISQAKDEETPLQKKLSQLSKTLSFLVLGICVFIFALRLFQNAGAIDAAFAIDAFMIAVSLAVAAIPEGLVAVVTIVLSIGVTNMSRRSAIIRKLTAVETLGCTQIICSDKTGTLTQNKMTVVEYSGEDEKMLAAAFSLCTNAEPGEDGKAVGDPTENAVVDWAAKLGLPKTELNAKFPRVGEIPFDSVRKLMTTVHKRENDYIQYTSGAPDVVIGRCVKCYRNGRFVPMTSELRDYFLSENHRLAGKALRVLASSCREHAHLLENYESENLENELCFLGLVGMIDPVRAEVPAAIEECRAAGIRPIMITGDHRDTAAAIAMQLGIIKSPDEAITGAQLNEIPDDVFAETVTKYSVYARVQPEHKVRIVNAWKARGKITAMTGDGVNDAPSIKSADIGVGMGITGTDVTKNVADMILADDNFATIIHATEEGRRIYDNIKKAIQFLLGSNLSEVLAIFTATMLGFTVLKPVHLLWINLVTDTFPAVALGTEKPELDIMSRPPRDPKEGIFSGGMGRDIIYQGAVVAALTLGAFLIGERIENGIWALKDSKDGITMAFLTMSMAEVFHSFNLRSQRASSVATLFQKRHNKLLYGAMIMSLVLTTAVIEIPFLANAFGFTPINFKEYLIALGLALSVIPIVETVKAFQRLASRKKQHKKARS